MIRRHHLADTDSRRLANLCGPLDAHLRQIEERLAVRIGRRDAEFRVEGDRESVPRAIALIDRLHEMAVRPLDDERLRLALVEASGARARAETGANGTAGAAGASRAQRRREPAPADTPPPPKRGPGSREAGAAAVAAGAADGPPAADAPIVLHTRHAELAGRTPNQVQYLRQILAHDITFGIGPAGTGKTFLAVACAVDALERQGVQRIVLTRPAVEAGERLGFLPGDLAQKVDPYLRPLYDALYDLMGFDRVGKAFEKGQIEIAPLAFMRGRTLNHAFVILDEAQNTTREQMKMFLTRMGFRSKCVVTGDISQVDLPKGQPSGLVEARQILAKVNGIAFTDFTAADVVRHPLVARIVEAYDRSQAAGGRAAARSGRVAAEAPLAPRPSAE